MVDGVRAWAYGWLLKSMFRSKWTVYLYPASHVSLHRGHLISVCIILSVYKRWHFCAFLRQPHICWVRRPELPLVWCFFCVTVGAIIEGHDWEKSGRGIVALAVRSRIHSLCLRNTDKVLYQIQLPVSPFIKAGKYFPSHRISVRIKRLWWCTMSCYQERAQLTAGPPSLPFSAVCHTVSVCFPLESVQRRSLCQNPSQEAWVRRTRPRGI